MNDRVSHCVDTIHFCGFSGHFKGRLDLCGSHVTCLPDGLVVSGTLDLDFTRMAHLPNELSVGFNLYLEDTLITQLPSDIKVGNSVWLVGSGVPEYTKKPKGVRGKLVW
jgi:hypothetical protein